MKNGGGGVHLIAARITYRIRLSAIQNSKNTVINTVILVGLSIKKSMGHNYSNLNIINVKYFAGTSQHIHRTS
jgi:hypothetical protein